MYDGWVAPAEPWGCHLSPVATHCDSDSQTSLPWTFLLHPKEMCCLLRAHCCRRQVIKQSHCLTTKSLANKGQLPPNNLKPVLVFSRGNEDKIHEKDQSYRRMQKKLEKGKKKKTLKKYQVLLSYTNSHFKISN